MDYPATQVFVNNDEDEEEEDTDDDAGTPLRSNKNVKVGILVADSANYPVHAGINTIGRIDSCSIVIDDITISKEHAEIEAGAGSKSTFIVDLGSLNKTRLNDVILRPGRGYQLRNGDVVQFGSVIATFKVEETPDEPLVRSKNNSNEFVIPETPAPLAREIHPVIPGTPDLSFDRSLTDVNRSGDVSVIAGTQDVENTAGSVRGPNLDPDKVDDASETSAAGRIDISDLETQKNSIVDDSDEENIFDMMTQKTDIHDDETQRFSTENHQAVKPSRYIVDKIESHSSAAIEDMETQKFSNDDGGVMARLKSINDLETQKFTLHNAAHGSSRNETRVDSINDLETQMFTVVNKIQSINDVETQKFEAINNEDADSETDEEGIFENSDDAVVDMFDAPTQLIRAPREVSKSPCEVEINNVAAGADKEEEIEEPVASVSAEERVQTPVVDVKTDKKLKINEEKIAATLNDSIESKLNHMFDDVNETAIDQPTQMLTQHLENVLESTQAGRSGLRQRKGDTASVENANRESSKSDNRNDDDDTAKSVDEEADDEPVKAPPEESFSSKFRMPKLQSSEDLFGDLPAVDMFETTSARSNRGRIKLSPVSDVADSPRSEKTEQDNARNFSGGPKRAVSTESNDSIDSKRSNSSKDDESTVAESEITPIKKGQHTPKTRGRKKAGIQNEVVSTESPADNLEETSPKIEEPMKAESRKGLPLKKRGSSILSGPPTPQKTITEVVTTVRVATRSNAKISVETGKRSTRLSAVDSPKVQDSPKRTVPSSAIRGSENPEKPESSTTKNEPLNRNKKNTRSRKPEDASSSGDQNLKTEIEPQPISSPIRNTRNLRKKPLDTSAPVTPEEVTAVKRARISTTVSSPSNVNDRPRPVAQRETRRNAKPRELNLSESSEVGINQNQSLPTRSLRARPAANTSSTDNSKNSLLARENSNSLSHQSSLESQEIQAILGEVVQGENEARGGIGLSRYRKDVRVFPSHMTGNDFRKVEEDRESSRQGFMGFTKAEMSKRGDDLKEEFERPMGKGERNKRPLPPRPPQIYDDEDLAETSSRKRPNLRGKKNADVVNKDDLLKPETSRVIVATTSVVTSNVKSEIKPTKKEKIATKNIKAESNHSLPREIVVKENTPKSRKKRLASRRVVDQPGKENVVEESPPKRGRKRIAEVKSSVNQNSTVLTSDDQDKVSESPSPLRRGRSALSTPISAASSSVEIKHKILFTAVHDTRLVSIVNNLGGTITEKPNDCTVLVTDKVRRTSKFLCCMAMAVPIVSIDWLTESDRRGKFLETGDFILQDPVAEAERKFNLRRSLAMATGDKLLEGYTIVLTPNMAPPPIVEMKSIIQACGGKALVRPPARWADKSLIISRPEDIKNAKKFLSKAPKSVHLLTTEFILTGILRHELNFEEHKLDIH